MNEDAIRADKYAKALLDKDILSFWKHIRKSNNARVPLATTIGGITGENEIAEMWQDHYKSILSSVKTNSRQQFVTNKLSSIRGESILFSTSDINVALHSLKSGTSCGVDGLAAEYSLFAHRITHVFLSLLFNTFMGAKVNAFDYTVWKGKQDDIMKSVLNAKFTQHDDLRKSLLDTGTKTIAETNATDSYWANGLPVTSPHVLNKDKWAADGNKLGMLQMNLRQELVDAL